MDLMESLMVSAAGMKVQGDRLRVVAENLANADSVSEVPGGDPYRRKVITFKNALDKELGLETVQVSKVGVDQSDFRMKYEPGNPAADAKGYVKLPNVDSLVEIMDMREAQRSYEADLSVMESTKQMLAKTVDLLNK